jgi:hypothetical protein
MKKIGLVFLALVIGLAGVGAAMACWSGALNINGTVNTATFGLCLERNSSIDQGSDTIGCITVDDDTIYVKTQETSNDIAQTAVTTEGCDVSFTVDCAYPSYYNDISLHVCNDSGCLPAEMTSVDLTFDGRTQTVTADNGNEGKWLVWYELDKDGYPVLDSNDNPVIMVVANFGDNLGTCIEKGVCVEDSFEFVFGQGIAEGAQYSFNVVIHYAQCNCCEPTYTDKIG